LRASILQLEVTTRCNRDCPICLRRYMVRLRGAGDIDPRDAGRVIETLRPRVVALHGWGEPFLHPQLSDIVAYAKRCRVSTSLSTNCDCITPSKLRGVVEAGLDELVFGFYTRDHLDNLYRILDSLVEVKREYSRPRVVVDITLIEGFEEDSKAIIRETADIDAVDAILLHRLFDLYGIEEGFRRLSIKKERDLIRYAKSVVKGKMLITPPKHKVPCTTAWLGPFVSWRLEVFPCCFLAVPSYSLGKIGDDEWRNRRKQFINSMKRSEVCINCPAP